MRRLGLQVPIVQGPFGGGLSTATLAATVSNLGGLGSFGAHVLAPHEIEATAHAIRGLTDRPFALNLWVSDHDPGGLHPSADELAAALRIFRPYLRELGLDDPEIPSRFHPAFEEQVEALLEARPPAFSFVFGIPRAEILAACRQRGIATIGAATTVAEARALDEAGVDLIVASGFEAGGHRPSFLARAEDSLMGTFALVPLVADRVKAPVIAAGGIVDRRGVAAALELGAQAAQVGTAFLACEESGRLARGVRNRWTDEMAARIAELPPFPITGFFTSILKRAAVAAGRTDLVSLWGSQAAPNLQHTRAAHLMAALTSEN
jgi:nitronate monooxygenase